MRTAHKVFKKSANETSASSASDTFVCTRKKYRQVVRQCRVKDSLNRYEKLDNIFTKPSAAYAYIKSCRKTKPRKVEELKVANKVFVGPAVCDGFYESMTALKQCNMDDLRTDPNISSKLVTYENIMQLCKNQPHIPTISLSK